MLHRIFIAINLPSDIKMRLSEFQDKWPELPARWTKRDSLHITLSFIGAVADDKLVEICDIARNISIKYDPVAIKLEQICYGPTKKMPPRMIWAIGAKSEILGKIVKDLENSLLFLSNESEPDFKSKNYIPHITLARIKQWEWRRIEPEEIPEMNEEINLNFEAQSIDVMESFLKKDGPQYLALESLPFNSNN